MLRLTVASAPHTRTPIEALAMMTLDEIHTELRVHGMEITRTHTEGIGREGERHTFVLDPPTAGSLAVATVGVNGSRRIMFELSGVAQTMLGGPMRNLANRLGTHHQAIATIARAPR
ncbi:hypothetical protein G4X40_05805 [Rhodococcus sp. D2-41]|uniref:hypothetical protein n=1 Tax=Speluncibacter jeojiensis TaxID=2710754 RepID=UPI00240F2221|nr:hypothetical protein [Rhodococcus sp. D2-41]MDG3009658.1 hypothetical protein [Rhodococcus sp. D2-41]